jgi:hypothetical protein
LKTGFLILKSGVGFIRNYFALETVVCPFVFHRVKHSLLPGRLDDRVVLLYGATEAIEHGAAGDDHHRLAVDRGALLGLQHALDAVCEEHGVDRRDEIGLDGTRKMLFCKT